MPREHPRRPAPARTVLEESSQAAGTCRSRTAGGVHRGPPHGARRRAAGSAPLGLSRQGPYPPRRRSRLWLGRARHALPCRLVLTGTVRQGLVLRAVSLQRRPSEDLALPARQWRTHDRCLAPPDVLRRLRQTIPAGKLVVIWDGAPY